MTDRIQSLTVVLEHDMRDDDVCVVTDAIRQLRGVLSVATHVVDGNAYMARQRAGFDVAHKLRDMANELLR